MAQTLGTWTTFSISCSSGRRASRPATSSSCFAAAAPGRAWLAGIIDRVDGRGRAVLSEGRRWVSVAFTWNGLRALGWTRPRWPHFPRSFVRAWWPRRDPWRHRRQSSRSLGGGLASPTFTRSRCCLPATRRTGAVRAGARAKRRAVPRRRSALDARSGGDSAVRLCARSLRLSRSPVAAGDRGGRRANTRFRPPAQGGRVLPRLSGRKRRHRPCRSRRSCRATAAFWPIGGSRNTSAPFANF